MHFVNEKDIPAWYELDIKNYCILILVPNNVAEFIRELIKPEELIIKHLRTNLKLPKFTLPVEENWGFGKVLSTEEKDGRTIWKCELPVIKSLYNFASSKSSWKDSNQKSASLNVLFKALSIYEDKTNSDFPQILTVEMSNYFCDAVYKESSISARLSPSVMKWIASQTDNSENKEILNTMINVYSYLYASKSNIISYFRASIRHPKRIDLVIPDGRCELNPEYYCANDENLERGYVLCPHNVDTDLQQLTLLSGLAKLYQLVKNNLLASKPPTC